jgi:D-alanine transfer protein
MGLLLTRLRPAPLRSGRNAPIVFQSVNTGVPQPKPHLIAVSAALLILALAVASGWLWCTQLEAQYASALARDLSDAKLQGVALQRAAFAQPDLLVLYGSSELLRDVPNTAAQFFAEYPSGFRVFPVGKMGTGMLSMAEKIAAVGSSARGRKVAYSLSPSLFFEPTIDPSYYSGNFSVLQARQLAYSTELSFGLKRDFARRMLAYPDTLEDHWLLDSTLRHLASSTNLDRILYYAALPLGMIQNFVGRTQDHFEAAIDILGQPDLPESPYKKRRILNWAEHLRQADIIAKGLAAKAAAAAKPPKPWQPPARHPHGSRDALWLAKMNKATEWTDLNLLLRTLRELGARPLLLSMPVHGADLEAVGVSKKARAAYPQRMHDAVAPFNMPLVYFKQHEDDPLFFSDHFDHLGAKGWVYYDETLDAFFHEETPHE